MARVVIEISADALSIGTLNDKCHATGNAHNAVNKLIDLLGAITAGAVDATVQVTTRDTTASVSTSGTGSTQETYNLA